MRRHKGPPTFTFTKKDYFRSVLRHYEGKDKVDDAVVERVKDHLGEDARNVSVARIRECLRNLDLLNLVDYTR